MFSQSTPSVDNFPKPHHRSFHAKIAPVRILKMLSLEVAMTMELRDICRCLGAESVRCEEKNIPRITIACWLKFHPETFRNVFLEFSMDPLRSFKYVWAIAMKRVLRRRRNARFCLCNFLLLIPLQGSSVMFSHNISVGGESWKLILLNDAALVCARFNEITRVDEDFIKTLIEMFVAIELSSSRSSLCSVVTCTFP